MICPKSLKRHLVGDTSRRSFDKLQNREGLFRNMAQTRIRTSKVTSHSEQIHSPSATKHFHEVEPLFISQTSNAAGPLRNPHVGLFRFTKGAWGHRTGSLLRLCGCSPWTPRAQESLSALLWPQAELKNLDGNGVTLQTLNGRNLVCATTIPRFVVYQVVQGFMSLTESLPLSGLIARLGILSGKLRVQSVRSPELRRTTASPCASALTRPGRPTGTISLTDAGSRSLKISGI